ncbi:hypothetical protein Y032_0026g1428 [Ancylostoma ceylanicum]|uniref:GIY-YIG domain-containing protein n=1 Tax=Ancylostoma ceylanicum TaxID=53326 RepID=A0A016UV76_9BILA|nr:hypothetical protein Y032_0026g1428 [Ancylostoma ceylanicum]
MRIAQETTTHDSTTTIRRAEDILRENGYRYEPSYCWKPHHSLHGAVMVMPYVDERLANRINCAVRNSKIPARLIFRPPRSLKELLTSSRQYESVCVREHCSICTETQICGLKNTVYEVKCMACFETYIGETSRPLFERIDEHRRALTQPASYTRNAFSRHRTLRHTMERPPKLDVSVLHRNMRDPLERKIPASATGDTTHRRLLARPHTNTCLMKGLQSRNVATIKNYDQHLRASLIPQLLACHEAQGQHHSQTFHVG